MSQLFPEDIDELNAELRRLLDAELSAGNVVVETWRGWPSAKTVAVALRCPFRVPAKDAVPDSVVFRDVDDPHYWKAEYVHSDSEHMIVCRFGN
ncbi:hypothetical protein SH528x_001677 [Novipirellula sp. SH528]|uniref:hypothetical protein n=1 Tax=Novipirellula sp. SH528 TaxID=3454466 RepID=UPI003FA0ED67